MEKPDDQYLWEAEKEESPPEISVCQGVVGFAKFLFFMSFTLSLIPFFLILKIFYKWTDVKIPMLVVRKFWSRVGLKLCGLNLRVQGRLSSKVSMVVCNHVSWLDILVIQSVTDVVFVAKSEVKTWPGLGFLAQLADTLFVERKPQKIGFHSKEAAKIMSMGNTICFFPEGTSSDGLRVLKFRSSFFQLAYNNVFGTCNPVIHIQPLSLFYAPHSVDKGNDFYGWWGSMSLFTHMVKVLCQSSGTVTLKFHHLLSSSDYQNRKQLASKAEKIIGDEVAYNISTKNFKV